jgi:multidrug efflux system outer membrane protein
MKALPILFLSSLLAACAVGPDYKTPDTAPAQLINAKSTVPAPLLTQTPDGLWWQQFDDPVLNALVTQALASNLDLRIAVDRVRAARAAFSGAEYDYGPHVPLAAAYSHSDEQQPGFGSSRIDATGYSLGFDASWEIDLFGHVRRSVEAARGDLGAEQANLRDAQITVAAEVARNYFALRGTQQQIAVAQRNLANQTETVRLTSIRYEAGRGTELDVQSSRARLKATEATLPLLETARAAATYRLAVLLGERPGALDEQLLPVATPAYAQALPIGDAGELLRNRPDVRAAEQQLAASTARVGIATAELFPRVSVTGFIGFLSGDFGHLFSASSASDARAWSVAPTVSWAALDYGSVQARLRGSKAQADAALANYQKTVLTALEDTENAFVNYREQQNRLKSLIDQATASRRAAELADIQYREGVTDFLTLLDAQRTQLAAEDAVAQSEAQVNTSVVAIYKALGGVGQPAEATVAAR